MSLNHHLKEKHGISPMSTYLREIVYGGTDGIVTTFAVVAGFAGAERSSIDALPVLVVLLFGFANLAADGVSMALGGFLATRADHDVYRAEEAKERHEIIHDKKAEINETIEILTTKGFTQDQAKQLATLYSQNEQYWVDFMMQEELSMQNPKGENPFIMSLVTFLSFIVFGFLPLAPYVFVQSSKSVFPFSIVMTGIALILLGILRYNVTNRPIGKAIGESLLLGGAAASVAYAVGVLFKI